MSHRRYRCLKLANTNRAFCTHENTSSDLRPPGEIRLSKRLNLSTSSSSSLERTRFGFQSVQSCNRILYVIGTKCIPNMPTLSFKRSGKTCNSLGSSLITTCSKPDRLLSEKISIPVFSRGDRAISITKGNEKEDNHGSQHFLR